MEAQAVPTLTGVRNALSEATHSCHAAVGSMPAMRRVFADDYSLMEYQSHLARMLGFFEPLELAVANSRLPALAAPHFLRRAEALRNDLASMGWTEPRIAAIERCAHLPAVPPHGVLGYLYVVLGSMLGGRIIAQRLRGVLGPQAGFHYYGEGSGEGDARWTAFCRDLERSDADDLGSICATATATFGAFARWMESDRSLSIA